MVLLHTITDGATTCDDDDEEKEEEDLRPAKKLIELNDAGNCNTYINA